MNTATYLGLLVVLAVVALLKGGLSTGTIVTFSAAASLAAIPWYFGTRDRRSPPSRTETFLAALWVGLRRLVGFSVGGYLFFGAFSIAISNPGFKQQDALLLEVLALLGGGVFFFYLGFFGQGNQRSALRDDIRLHAENKRRYRWWF
jgi:hypothetical protein